MKIKKLKWKDNVTKLGKQNGMFFIIANVKELHLYYYISNYKLGDKPEKNKYYFCCSIDDILVEYKNLKEAKINAQKHFEQTVLKLFFD